MDKQTGRKPTKGSKKADITYVACYNCFDPKTGTTKKKWKRGFRKKKDAANYVYEQENQVSADAVNKDMLFSKFCDYWLTNYAKVNCKKSTLGAYIPRIEKYIKPNLGYLKLCQIEPYHILSYYQYLRENTDLSEHTILHHHRLLHNLLEWAFDWKFISHNPVSKRITPNVEEKEVVYWDSIEVIVNAIKKAEGDAIEIPILLGIFGGLRRGEILGLKYTDIDYERNLISIRRAVGQKEKGWGSINNQNAP